jgi:ATP-binding cassette, subfamily F, member 3
VADARNFLGQFLFSGDDVFKPISALSGGQRSRVALARLTLQGANFLLLDEPTNHLDLASQEVLQEVLARFPGTILLVSHDRYLVEALATHIWWLAGEELRAYKGNYSEYLRQHAEEAAGGRPAAGARASEGPGQKVAAATAVRSVAEPAPAARELERERTREERRQRRAAEKLAEQAAALEAEFHRLEASLEELSGRLEVASLAGDVERVQALGLTYQQTEERLQQALCQWADLA